MFLLLETLGFKPESLVNSNSELNCGSLSFSNSYYHLLLAYQTDVACHQKLLLPCSFIKVGKRAYQVLAREKSGRISRPVV